ncbi:uncharacterized protein CC84DRAFT_608293 [Paraphaeosphaeria sporulosa]|uniref:Uncharacterized protein n=1 Tax=Paraphaeosphaeria sporulosa TaxID=1460663 RepID=A0A177CQT5_9PLEO|nr:uncharacterized protein CC84DRAFT_608293 [Paraphaeosphaeria sporulosa]OAG09139.1 hypothetical protein CC84DRAFT_608293 [Paraphaeosphaeria sporulosa]
MAARFVVAQVCAPALIPPTVSGRGCSGTKHGERPTLLTPLHCAPHDTGVIDAGILIAVLSRTPSSLARPQPDHRLRRRDARLPLAAGLAQEPHPSVPRAAQNIAAHTV